MTRACFVLIAVAALFVGQSQQKKRKPAPRERATSVSVPEQDRDLRRSTQGNTEAGESDTDPRGEPAAVHKAVRHPSSAVPRGNPNYNTLSSSPSPVVLSKRLFVTTVPELDWDRDHDFQFDSGEHELAERVAPYLQFSQYENALRAGEPRTLYQVQPAECSGFNCPVVPANSYHPSYRYKVKVRFILLFQWDGGWGGEAPGSWCPGDSHLGDIVVVTMKLVSMDAITWHFTNIRHGKYQWPLDRFGHRTTFKNGPEGIAATHVVLYLSAGKHHSFFNDKLHDEDSPYGQSASACNDAIDGAGVEFLPKLHTSGIEHNVGERNAHEHFVDNLGIFGWRNYRAWDTSGFIGDVQGIGTEWFKSEPAPYSGILSPEGLGVVTGRVSTIGGSAPDLKLYLAPDGGTAAPWTTVPLQPNGSFEVTLSAGASFETYVFRPVASDYDFIGDYETGKVPATAVVVPASPLHLRFEGERTRLLPIAPKPPKQSKAVAVANEPSLSRRRGTAVAVETASQRAADEAALRVVLAEQMVVQSGNEYYVGEHSAFGLPRASTVRIDLRQLLNARSGLAATFQEAFCSRDGSESAICETGDGVAGAELEVSIQGGVGYLEPGAEAKRVLKTNRAGVAELAIQTGTHPGRIRLEVRVVSNPDNHWLRPVRFAEIEVQPIASGDDIVPGLRPRLLRNISSGVRYRRIK